MNSTLKSYGRLALRIFTICSSVIVLLLIYFIFAIRLSIPEKNSEVLKYEVKSNGDFRSIGKNWLRKSNSGLWEMYLEGDGFERGVINGKLTKDLAEFQETVFINQIKELVPSPSYLNVLKYFVAYFNRKLPDYLTEEYRDEIYGVSLSASDKFDNLAPKYYRILNYHGAHDIGHALQDKNMTVGCTSFGIWNSKTPDGEILLGRNFDFFAGEDFAKNKIVCFVKPTTGNKFMYVTWAGFTGVVSGMNDKGLTVTINAAKSDIPSSAATPISILAKEILQYASNIEQAYAIAQKSKTFVSESILVGSAKENKASIIEKTPTRCNLYDEKRDRLVCSNHYKSKMFEHDYINNKNIIESSSVFRQYKMEQMLNNKKTFTPQDAAAILRNQDGINNKKLGLTNEKGINQLIAHHSIIFKPKEKLVWVSTSPFQLGEYICYNLDSVFNASALPEDHEINEAVNTIPADPFLQSKEYKNFILFKEIKNYFRFCTKSEFDLKINEELIDAFVKSNPNSYFTYWIIGDYFAKIKNTELAGKYYSRALEHEIATRKEEREIRTALNELKTKE